MSDFSFNSEIKGSLVDPELYVGPATTNMKSNYKAYYQIARNLPNHAAMKILTGYNFKPKKVIVNHPATIVIWNDDTKTVVKCNDEYDNYNLTTGILLCFMKKLFGNNNNYHKILYDAINNAEWQFDDEED